MVTPPKKIPCAIRGRDGVITEATDVSDLRSCCSESHHLVYTYATQLYCIATLEQTCEKPEPHIIDRKPNWVDDFHGPVPLTTSMAFKNPGLFVPLGGP